MKLVVDRMTSFRPGTDSRRFEKFVELLAQLKIEQWRAFVTEAPSCAWMMPYSQAWPFGRFASLYLILGLNNYQLKGKAEVGYWPKVIQSIPSAPIPSEPHEIQLNLAPFYKVERMSDVKVRRLKCFTESALCYRIWNSDAKSVANDFLNIWADLAFTMDQKPQKKTIVFGMKLLAYALILVNENGFDFGSIPIPVDSRVCALSCRLGLPSTDDNGERARWSSVLRTIQGSNPEVTMVHLDSVLWQIGTLSKGEIVSHMQRMRVETAIAQQIADTVG